MSFLEDDRKSFYYGKNWKSLNYPEVKELAVKIDKSTTFSKNKKSVLIIHADGSCMFFKHAFMLRHHLWLLVFTEHQGIQIYHINDLSHYEQFEGINGKIDQVNEFGEIIKEVRCCKCYKMISVEESSSLFDKLGNREDKEICNNCHELLED